MSDQIATAYSQKYATGIELLAQQMTSATQGTCREEGTTGSKREFFDQVGRVKMQPKTGRAVDVPIVNTPHARRSVTALDRYMRDFIDEFDKLKVLNDPSNTYAEAGVAAGMRERDLIFINAALGTAYTGEDGTTAVPLPSAQKIAAGGTGFTLTKHKQAVRMLKSANIIMPGDKIYCLWTAKQEEEYINSTEVKSFDYNNQKVMVDGQLTYFYGTYFRRVEDTETAGDMLPKVSTTRTCVFYVSRAMLRYTWKPVAGKVEWIAERQAYQVYTGMSEGCTRMQEVGVVQADVVEN